MKPLILLDSGHGQETPGKRSPDKSLMEWAYTREIASRVQSELQSYGLDTILVVEDETDMPLSQRANKVNKLCKHYKTHNPVLVSIHVNAAGCGEWKNARGWECYTTEGKTKSDLLAEELYKAARIHLPDMKIRMDKSDGDMDKEKDFTIIYKTKCPAVLTENLFMDNKEDCEFLLSEEGKESIVNIHVDGIMNYFGYERSEKNVE